MRHRRKISRKASRRQFARTATAVRKKNNRARPMRGGFRI